MAQSPEDIQWLYDNLKSKGYDIGSKQEFSASLANEDDRRWYYDKGIGMGLDLGSMDDFNELFAPQTAAKPQQTAQQQLQQPAQVPVATQPAQPEGWKPSPMQQQEFQRQAEAGMDRLRQQGEWFTQRMENMRKANKPGAFMGERELNPETGQTETAYYTTRGERTTNPLQQQMANAEHHKWWEDNTEAGRRSKEQRLQQEFDNQLSALWERHDTSGENNAAEQAWAAAEARLKAAKEKNAQQNWDDYAAMGAGAGREMRMVTASRNRHDDRVARLTNFDLDRLMNDSWDNLGEDGQKALIDDCYQMLRRRNPDADELVLYNQAKDFARHQSDLRLYNLAVEKNRPKSELDYLVRKIGDMNMLTNISKGLAVSQAKSTGDMAAYEAANEQYRQDGHKILDVVGMVAGFGMDPTTWLAGGVGSVATRGALWAGGLRLAGRGSKAAMAAGSRAFANTLTGRIAGGVVGGGVNFGTFEGVKEMENQFAHGGHIAGYDEVGRYVNDGYSASAVGGQALHGLGMGAAIGWLGPVTGNVSDRLVQATSSTAGKVAIRSGLYAGATIAEGTIFSIPEWIEGERDAFDVWTDNMTMMVGFKAKHIIKSAGGVLGDLKASFDSPTNGTKNRLDFESRLRQRMDAPSDGGLALTKDEKAELQRYGYDLRDLVRSSERTGNAADGALIAQNAPEIVSRLTEMVNDSRLSEAARAKMYFYATGRKLPMSTIMRGELLEDGNGGFIVESQGANGVVTSRSFKNRKAADLELERINRQAELNRIELGERYQQANDLENRMQDACRTVAAENGWNMVEVYRTCEEARRNSLREGDKQFDEVQQNILRKVADALGEIEETSVTDAIRGRINEKYGVDIDSAIRKDANRRTQAEQTAITEYIDELTPERARVNPVEDVAAEDISNQQRIANRGSDYSRDEFSGETEPIGRAVMKYQDRQVEVLSGRVVMNEDGTSVDAKRSDASVVIRDIATGKVEMIAPEAILSFEDYGEAPAAPQSKYTAGLITIRNADGTEIRGWLTGEVDENGNHEYLIEGDMQSFHYASDNELDNILIDYQPDTSSSPESDGGRPAMEKQSSENLQSQENDVNLQHGNGPEQDHGGSVGPEGSNAGLGMATDSARGVEADRDRSDIRVYEEGLGTSYNAHSDDSERDRREAESERLVSIARKQGHYRSREDIATLGKRQRAQSGESDVFVDQQNGRVYKVKNPYAKSPMKGNVQPEDAIYEHLVHNKYFPETRYQFEGISDDMGDVRIILSQGYVPSVGQASKEQIESALAEKGLFPDGKYRFGNDEISVTDVTGDNALMGADGQVYFIDPIIDFKKPVREILSDNQSSKATPSGNNGAKSIPENIPIDAQGRQEYDKGYSNGIEIAHDLPDAQLTEKISQLRNDVEMLTDFGRGWLEAHEYEQQRRQMAAQPAPDPNAGLDGPRHAFDKGAPAPQELTPLQRIPHDEKGEPMFELAESPEVGWDALVEFSEGDVATAKEIADTMAEEKRKAYERAQKLKSKGKTPTEILASKKANAAQLAQAENEYNLWQRMAGIEQARQNAIRSQQEAEARRLAAERAEAEKAREQQQQRQDEIQRQEAREEKANRPGLYAKAMARWDEPLSAREYMLRDIAGGGVKFRWSDDEHSKTHGVGKHITGGRNLAKSWSGQTEFGSRRWMIDDKDGIFPEAYAERVCQEFYNDYERDTDHFSEVFGELLDILLAHPTSKSMYEAAREIYSKYREDSLYDPETRERMKAYGVDTPDEVDFFDQYGMRYWEYEAESEMVEAEAENKVLSDEDYSELLYNFAESQIEDYERSGENSVNDERGVPGIRQGSDGVLQTAPPDVGGRMSETDRVGRATTANSTHDGTHVPPQEAPGRESRESAQQERLTKEEATDIITKMEMSAVSDPQISLSPESWENTFGLSNSIGTPLGKVKMGEGQYQKLVDKKRSAEFGMVVQTLQDPDVVFIEPSEAKEGQTTERGFSYVFVKTFIREGKKFKYYTSVSVLKDGMEVSVSSHIASKSAIMKKLQGIERAYTKESLLPNSSEWHLAEHPSDVPDLLPTQGKSEISERKVTNSASEKQAGAAESSVQAAVEAASAEVNTSPTPAQAEAGNYKMEHRRIDGFNISIENPKGSVRRGKDADGKEWQTEMHNDYGYIRGTEGVDGDHIDVFLSDTPEEGDVFVIDQHNEDGSFDEHKVMYGFPSEEAAREAYLSNYEQGWTGLGAITHVSKEEFKKWVRSSKRKTKPFADYKSVRDITYNVDQSPTNVNDEGMIVDAEGKPLTLYHGTPNDVEMSDLEMGHTRAGGDESARYNGNGISFTPNRDVADDYASQNGGKGKVFEVNVTLKKPYYTLGVANFTPEEAAEFTASLQAKGHDGIINYQSKAMREAGAHPNEVIVFDVKSATPAQQPMYKKKKGTDSSDGVMSVASPSTPVAPSDNLSSNSVGDEKSSLASQMQIDDFGEKIAGARKDMLGTIAKTVENTTVQALVELPLNKVFKRPNLQKLVTEGVIGEDEAVLAEAVMQSMIFSHKKPAASRRASRKQEISDWATNTHKGIVFLGEILSGDEERRDKALAKHRQELTERVERANDHIRKMRLWNPGQTFMDVTELPDELEIMRKVLEGINYRVGDKINLPLSKIEPSSTYQSFIVGSAGKQGCFWFNRSHRSLEEAIDTMIFAAKLSRGDMDIELPEDLYLTKGVGNPHKVATGNFEVRYLGGRNGLSVISKVFADEVAAGKFAKEKQGKVYPETRHNGEFDSYSLSIKNPLTGNRHMVGNTFNSREEVDAWYEEHREEVNRLSLEAINNEMGVKSQTREHFYVTSSWDRGAHRVRYSVVEDDRKNPWPIVKDFQTQKEAETWLKENLSRLEAERKAKREAERNVVYFENAAGIRQGKDWRGGRDATPELYSETFGFRGVQFGNWTNNADRQAALNEAYDAFMDLASVLGLTPKAMSLDGELGLAFGARGSGRASAHYEPAQVVINLTKTRGAGALAHEWWHAVDNFLSRRGGIAMGYVSHGNAADKLAPGVADSLNQLMSALNKSAYAKRSIAKGDYWGRGTELMARLFETWVAGRLKQQGAHVPFLVALPSLKALNSYQQLNYLSYKANEIRQAALEKREPAPESFDKFKERPESLNGYPYPTIEEVSAFDSLVGQFVTALADREHETGSIAMERGGRYKRNRLSTTTGMSLFDWADAREATKLQTEDDALAKVAESANTAIDEYAEAYRRYLTESAQLESELSKHAEADEARTELEQRLSYEEAAVLEARQQLEDSLRDYYALNNTPEDAERIARQMVARTETEVAIMQNRRGLLHDLLNPAPATEQLLSRPANESKAAVRTAGGFISYDAVGHLPDGKQGEFAYVERMFSRSGEFDFTGGNRVESRADVAYLFRSLADYSIEHVFGALVKDGKVKVIHIGMGGPTASFAYLGALRAAYDAFGADKVYLVHNHPSGNLRASRPDELLIERLNNGFRDADIEVEGIIIDTTSGRFLRFGGEESAAEENLPSDIIGNEQAIEVLRFDRQPQKAHNREMPQISSSAKVVEFINQHRSGNVGASYIILANDLKVVAHFHTDSKPGDLKGLEQELVSSGLKYGGSAVILYGNHGLSNEEIRALGNNIKASSLDGIRLMDVVNLSGSNWLSAQDEGILNEPSSEYGISSESDIRFREVKDDAVLSEFAEGKTVKAYRTMQVIDGKLYSPMATKVGGKTTPEIKLGVPEQAEEHPEIIKGTKIGRDGLEQGYVVIDKGLGKGTLTVAYNPYVHTSRTVLNDQFSSAYIRPNLVIVEVEVPESELTSGYRANMAKDAVGEISWHSGSVSGQLAELGKPRRGILTRYDRPVRIVPFREVATMIAEQLDGTDIAIPYNVVQPQLRTELERLGVAISEKATGTVTDEADFGKAEYITDQEIERINARQQEMAQTTAEAKSSHAEQLSKKFNTPVRIITDVNELPASLRNKKGAFDVKSEEVIVVIPNNQNVEDVAETIFHEVVAHKGLRELIGEENYDAFCDEVYNHLKEDLKQQVDEETTRRFMNEPGKWYEHHRRVSVDELFGRMSEKGFEDFSKAERSIWAKLKAKVLEAINKFLGALKLPKWVKLGDNELRYILWRSHERLRTKGDYIDMARDAAKREELGLRQNEAMREQIVNSFENPTIGGHLSMDSNRIFNEELQRYQNGQMKPNEILHLGNPQGIMRAFLPNIPIVMRQRVVTKGSQKKHEVEVHAIKNMPYHLSTPIFIFQRSEDTIGVLTDMTDRNGKNVCVAIEIERKMQHGNEYLEVNDIRSFHGRDFKNIVEPIVNNGTLRWVDKVKGLAYLSSASQPVQQEIDKQILYDAAKIVNSFENPTIVEEESYEYRFRDGETSDIWKDQSLGLEERITNAAVRLSNNQSGDLTLRNDAMRAIGGDLTSLRKAMAAQKKFDQSTVKRVADLARILMQHGYLSGMTSGEVQRLISAIKNSVGHNDTKNNVQKIMDIMVNNQLRNGESSLRQLLAIRGSKVDARGVEVQGMLDVDGQRTMEVVKKAMSLSEDDITDRIAESLNRMSDPDNTIADQAALEYAGLHMALDYVQNIANSKAEEKALRDSLKTAKEEKDAGRMANDAYNQFVEATEDAIRKNKIERAEAYFNLVGRLSDSLRGSIENAKAFREAEKARINEIHHNANSDMEGRATNEHHRDDWKDKVINNGVFQFLFAPLGTFDQIMRVFGNKSANGEGYLWNRFMRGWVDCRNKELEGVKEKFARLDEKSAELFGHGKTWGDIIRLESKLPKATVSFWDGGEMRDHELTQGNLLYIYMVDKMTDGRMKLRRMGITEDDITDVENFLDPRFKALGDWLQDEFLVETRNEYNETHKRMFGASMAAIENYFPLKILANARIDKEEDVNQQNQPEGITTKTGSIIKRRVNNLALDITGADALSVILDHITQMEHWSAYAEWNRDLNTLRTYKRFRNQVINMTTVYGGGRKLWENFNDLCLMAAGEYRPPIAKLDKSAVNLAKGVTAAKVSFRMFTALKQLLSAPAYIPEVSVRAIAKSIANPYGDFKWCLENMPIFRERWHSRISGDPRLLKSDMDWKMWRSRIMEISSRIGMTPNAFVDAVTVSIGARAMYETRLKQYIKEGYPADAAEKRAKQDATILFNQTQQSSESPFLSTMQVDRSWLSVLYTVFRNSAMSYTRQEYDAMRNLKRNLTPGQRAKSVEFMTKQILRDWDIDPDTATDAEQRKANDAARNRFRRQIKKDVLRIATFGFILEALWNLGPYLPYIFLGNEDDEKDKMWDDAMTHAYFGSIEGLTGGDVMSGFGKMAASGEWSWNQLTKDMPLASDINTIANKFIGGKNAEAVNDILNLLVQSGIGMNPQSLTDAAIAITDACGDDPTLSHEAAIFVMRVLQVPQSQLDKLYFDEIDLSGEEASKLTPEQLASRYAEYRVKRGTPLAPWSWDDEERLDKYEKLAKDRMKERLDRHGEDSVLEAYADFEVRYKAISEKAKEAKALMTTDYAAAAQALAAIQQDPDFLIYQRFGSLDKQLGRIAKMWLTAKSPEEAKLIAETIPDYRAGMVKVLQAETTEAQQLAMAELSTLMNGFYNKYQSMQQEPMQVNR
ncbi:MAG: JAB domain-containing protein [Bacteroides sp.]|nr:JAB domain-containing protein [Bacteroides sp.]